jgi:hypothetical protein
METYISYLNIAFLIISKNKNITVQTKQKIQVNEHVSNNHTWSLTRVDVDTSGNILLRLINVGQCD